MGPSPRAAGGAACSRGVPREHATRPGPGTAGGGHAHAEDREGMARGRGRATVGAVCRPFGAGRVCCVSFQGLTPLATDLRPCGAARRGRWRAGRACGVACSRGVPREHGTRLREHATRLRERATRPREHGTRLRDRASDGLPQRVVTCRTHPDSRWPVRLPEQHVVAPDGSRLLPRTRARPRPRC